MHYCSTYVHGFAETALNWLKVFLIINVKIYILWGKCAQQPLVHKYNLEKDSDSFQFLATLLCKTGLLGKDYGYCTVIKVTEWMLLNFKKFTLTMSLFLNKIRNNHDFQNFSKLIRVPNCLNVVKWGVVGAQWEFSEIFLMKWNFLMYKIN